MFERIKNIWNGKKVEKLSPYYELSTKKRTQHTPDLCEIASKEKHLLFVYDEMKMGYPNQDAIQNSEFICPVLTKDNNFVVWLKDYKRGWPSVAAATTPKPNPNDKRYDPRNPDPGRVRGELHLVEPETLFQLDELQANGIYFNRVRLEFQLPWSPDRMIKARGSWVPDEFPNLVEAWAYITTHEVIGDEPNRSISPVTKFKPNQRRDNLRYISNQPYFEFTKRDLKPYGDYR